MKREVIGALSIIIVFYCCLNNGILSAMEEQEPKKEKKREPRSHSLSPRRRSLVSAIPQISVKKAGTWSIRSRNTPERVGTNLTGPYPYVLVPHPFYFTSIKKAENYIKNLTSEWKKNINYQDEDGKTCAHYVFDLDNTILFENPSQDISEKSIRVSPLPLNKYFDLQCKFITLLLKQKDINFNIQDNQHFTPFMHLIHSISDEKTTRENKEIKIRLKKSEIAKDEANKLKEANKQRSNVKKTYIPKIFQLILYHGYHALFKKELLFTYSTEPHHLEDVKQRLSPVFPLYTSPNHIREFIRTVLPVQGGINTQDQNGMTLLHYLLFLNEELILDTYSLQHTAQLIKNICDTFKPNFTIQDADKHSPIDYLFFSLLHFKPEQCSPSWPTITISNQRSPKASDVGDISSIKQKYTEKQKPIEHIIRIFEHITRIHPHVIPDTFDKYTPSEKHRIASFISFFPVFVKVDRLKTLLAENRGVAKILQHTDEKRNNYVHHLADFSTQFSLFKDTPEERLTALLYVSNHSKGKLLISEKNAEGKLPLEVFIESVPEKIFRDERNQGVYQEILHTLTQYTQVRQYVTAASESPFPFFLTIQRLSKKLGESENNILKIIDDNGNTLLHCLTNPLNKHILLYDTPENRLASIELVLGQEQDKNLACQKNNDNKLPLDLLLKHLCTFEQDDPGIETYQKIASALLHKTIDENGNTYLHHLAQLPHENSLKFITFLGRDEQSKELRSQKNKENKSPLELLFASFFNTSSPHKKTMEIEESFRVATVQLAQSMSQEEIVLTINQLSKKNLRYLRTILSHRYHTHEKDIVEILRTIVSVRATLL